MSGRKKKNSNRTRKGSRPSRKQRKSTQTQTRRPHEDKRQVLPEAEGGRDPALDAGDVAGQVGENGSAPAGTGPGVPGADEAARPGEVGEGSPGSSSPPRPPSDIVRPYSIEPVVNAPAALQFSEWCQKQVGCDLGIGVVDDYVGVADQDVGWHLRPGPDLVGTIAGDALRDLLKASDPPHLIVQNMDQVMPLAHLLNLEPYQTLNSVVGDTSQLLDLLGRSRSEPPYWSSPADAAYDAFVHERHYVNQAPNYYKAVSVTRARQRALYTSDPVAKGLRWTLKFQDLLLRVIAHFTREPVLVMAFEDDKDPLAKVMELLVVEREEEAMALILWTIIGFDTPALAQASPEFYQHLPHAQQQEFQSLCTRKLAVLTNSYNLNREDLIANRFLTSLYGVQVGKNKDIGVAVAEKFFRSEREVLDVCAAAFWQDTEMVIAGVGWGGRVSSVNGMLVEGQKADWHDTISQVGQAVDSHLSVKPGSSLVWMD